MTSCKEYYEIILVQLDIGFTEKRLVDLKTKRRAA
jgi:hypothetical protein